MHIPLVIGAAAIPLMDLPLLFQPIHVVWLELVIHPTAMLAFQDLPRAGPLAPVVRHRQARFFSAGEWLGIALAGAMLSAAVVWSYLHALGADRDVDHARAMALSMLLVASAGITIGLTRLRHRHSWWLVAGTLASLGLLVQMPAVSRWLNLRPLHAMDWALIGVVLLGTCVGTLRLSSRLGGRAGASPDRG